MYGIVNLFCASSVFSCSIVPALFLQEAHPNKIMETNKKGLVNFIFSDLIKIISTKNRYKRECIKEAENN